jgi:hypothetical protein
VNLGVAEQFLAMIGIEGNEKSGGSYFWNTMSKRGGVSGIWNNRVVKALVQSACLFRSAVDTTAATTPLP